MEELKETHPVGERYLILFKQYNELRKDKPLNELAEKLTKELKVHYHEYIGEDYSEKIKNMYNPELEFLNTVNYIAARVNHTSPREPATHKT